MGMFLLVSQQRQKKIQGRQYHTHLHIHIHTLTKRYTEIKK